MVGADDGWLSLIPGLTTLTLPLMETRDPGGFFFQGEIVILSTFCVSSVFKWRDPHELPPDVLQKVNEGIECARALPYTAAPGPNG